MAAKEAIMFKADEHYYKVPVTMTDFVNIWCYQLMNDSVKLMQELHHVDESLHLFHFQVPHSKA